MNFNVSDLFQIFGSLAFFIFGMKMMSEGIQKAVGSQMRNLLRTMTQNRYLGVFTGLIITALLQSSSATTVMTVSFVNTGLLNLMESAGVMMGANVGTTITGWLVSVLGFKANLSFYSIPIFAIGVPLLFNNKGKLKYWGEFMIGFGILFLGLSYLNESVPSADHYPDWLAFINKFSDHGLWSRILIVLIGAIFTIIVQSSSAAMVVTLTLCAQGWLDYDTAGAMILGENIGTIITAELAALAGNVNAKRAARINTLFNAIGISWMIFAMPAFLRMINYVLVTYFDMPDAYHYPNSTLIALAAFHTVYNLSNVILQIGLVPYLVQLAIWSVKSKDEDYEPKLSLLYNQLEAPELAVIAVQKETAHFGEIVSRMNAFAKNLLNTNDSKEQKKILKKLNKYEKISDRMEIEISEFITYLYKAELTQTTSIRLRSILNICNDLERIGDLYYQFSKSMEAKINDRIYFLPQLKTRLNDLFDEVENAFEVMQKNLSTPSYAQVNIEEAVKAEDTINKLRNSLRDEVNDLIGTKEYNLESAMIYNNMFSLLEKVGDHIINVSESIVGEI